MTETPQDPTNKLLADLLTTPPDESPVSQTDSNIPDTADAWPEAAQPAAGTVEQTPQPAEKYNSPIDQLAEALRANPDLNRLKREDLIYQLKHLETRHRNSLIYLKQQLAAAKKKGSKLVEGRPIKEAEEILSNPERAIQYLASTSNQLLSTPAFQSSPEYRRYPGETVTVRPEQEALQVSTLLDALGMLPAGTSRDTIMRTIATAELVEATPETIDGIREKAVTEGKIKRVNILGFGHVVVGLANPTLGLDVGFPIRYSTVGEKISAGVKSDGVQIHLSSQLRQKFAVNLGDTHEEFSAPVKA